MSAVQTRTSCRVRAAPKRFGRDVFAENAFEDEERATKRRQTYINKYLTLTEGGIFIAERKKLAAVDVG